VVVRRRRRRRSMMGMDERVRLNISKYSFNY
jgi:hypothetical protein